MTPLVLLGWAIVGWCGTPWPGRWKWPPPPPPDPWWWMTKVIGVVGGVVGGWAFSLLFNADLANPAGVGLTFAGALAGSILANDIYGIATRGRAD